LEQNKHNLLVNRNIYLLAILFLIVVLVQFHLKQILNFPRILLS